VNYALILCFKGTAYCGWQVQSNALSVQTVVQNAVEQVFGTRLGISGCSRTDSGVHANELRLP
jgi:tRNA pseudouridine38-40 synthase